MSEIPTRAARREATAARILEAAQSEFGDRGVEGATIRGIASRAGVDPSLVLQHYGSKKQLFELAVRPAPDLTEGDVPAHLAEVLEIRMRELPAATRAIIRSMLTSTDANAMVRDYLQGRVENLARTSTREDSELRATVLVSSILGLTLARHFLDLPALSELDSARIEAIVAPWYATLT